MSEPAPVHSTAFIARRTQNWVFLGLMYGFFYMSRYNLSAIGQQISNVFGWTNTEYGSVVAAGSLVYGLSVFFNGPLADLMGGKRALLIGSAGAAGFNLLFGLCHVFVRAPAVVVKGALVVPATFDHGMTSSTTLSLLCVLWAGNHYFQSFGALSIVKVNAAWFHIKERGSFAGIFGIMIQSGRLAAFAASPFILRFLPWQYCFWIPAGILAVMFVAVRFLVEDSPAKAGLPDLHTGDESIAEAAEPASLGFILRKVFSRRTMWLIAASSMCIGMVRNSVDHWWAKYMATMFETTDLSRFLPYEFCTWAMPVCAILGGLAAGNASDRIFQTRRAPVIMLAFVGQALCLGLLSQTAHSAWAGALLLAGISFFIQGAHSLVGGAASMDFGGKKAVATAAGFFDGAQYLAGAVVGRAMGQILDHYKDASHHEYDVWPLAPIPFALVGAVLMITLWNAHPNRRAAH